MEIWQEPVRGAVLPPAAYAFSGLERLRGYGRRLFPYTPLHHQIGFRTTQVANGSAVASMPVTTWLAHPDGIIDVGLLAYSVCGLAAYTVLPPETVVVPLHLSYSPVRLAPSDIRSMVGRAHVVRTSPDWVYVEGSVEDDRGRIVATTSGHLEIRPVDFPVPDEPPAFEPQEPPSYPTPDPYQRPVPAEKHAGIEQFHELGAVKALDAIGAGELPTPPLYELGGIRPVDAAEGAVTTALTTSPWLQGVDPGLYPGWLAAFAVNATGGVMRTLQPPGMMQAILEASLTFLDSVPVDGRTITARAVGEDAKGLALTGVDVYDGDERVATGSVIARWVPERRRPVATTRTLATVLFTDIVGSTEQAERLGDTKWGQVLARHDALVDAEVAERGGRVVKSTGDGALVTFESPTSAVECARALCDAVGRVGVEIRAGIHTGEVEVSRGDLTGVTVHAAARIEAAAGPGEVWVSETTKTLTAGSRLSFVDRGEHDLKGLHQPLRLYRLE